MWLIVFGVFEQHTIHIGAGILIELVAGREDDQRYFAVTQHGQLVGFLHDAELALVEGHLRGRHTASEMEIERGLVSKNKNVS